MPQARRRPLANALGYHHIGMLEKDLAALQHDAERGPKTMSELATENEELRKERDELREELEDRAYDR